MRVSQPEHRRTCTVAVERNRYGAMTLRSEGGRTYQVVGCESPRISRLLDQLAPDSRVSVRLTRTHGRGDSWRVTEIDAVADRDSDPRSTGRQSQWAER